MGVPSRRPTSDQIVCVSLFAVTLAAGCGPSGPQRHAVGGSVTFAGEKISEGSIDFVPIGDTKGPRAGANIQQGQYHIDRSGGPVAGRHRVEVTAVRPTGRRFKVQQFIDVEPGNKAVEEVVGFIPAKYSGATSELVVEVQSKGRNVFDFDLKAK